MTDLGEIHRRHWAKVVAVLARAHGSLDLAEDAAGEAFAAAVERWPVDGTPDHPDAWLITVGRRKALDRLRREAARDAKQVAAHELQRTLGDSDLPSVGPMADDRLRLLFTCCHPALAAEAQIALTLRLIAGLSTAEVARAFWVTEATMAQRLVRAKRKIATARIPYRVPEPDELPERLGGVLRVVYLVFREGYTPSGGDRVVRVDLCEEAVRLARLVVDLLPGQSEARALLGLLLVHHSRRAARTDGAGDVVRLDDQDRRRWDGAAIREGAALAADALQQARGPYALQAAIAVCHAAPTPADTDWPMIAALYGELARVDPSPAVLLNRAVAVAEVDGPDAGLAMIDSLLSTPAGATLSRTSHHPHVARAELLRRMARNTDAAAAYRLAAQMAPTEPERRSLAGRLADLEATAGPAGGTGG